jgi:hypothetical protein
MLKIREELSYNELILGLRKNVQVGRIQFNQISMEIDLIVMFNVY